ncbi:MAG: hypothetical protein HKN79_09075 [Flavobacteriales bacterium]|nr:hypothetical protein [Flavobacteriales bacterium]
MKLTLSVLLFICATNAISQDRITADDLQSILGEWQGTITYLDYQSNEPFSMPAELSVEPGKDEYTLVLNNIYPNEPKANNSEKLKVSNDGTVINKEKLISRKELEDGSIRIQAERSGKDDGRKARIRHTYIIGSDSFLIRKDVRFDGGEEWIMRSEYRYTRKS